MKPTSELLEKMEKMARIGSWELDLVNNRVTWSDEVYRIFGLTIQTFSHTNEGFMECVHPDDRAMVHEISTSALEKDLDRYEYDYRIVRKDNGQVRYVHEICEHVRDTDGTIIGSQGILQDITERKELEYNLKISTKKANDAVQAKSRFLASMSHEIRTPLNGLVGMLHLMKMTELTEEQEEIVSIAQTSSDILLNLINNILDYSKLGADDNQLDKYSFQLPAVLEEIKSIFLPMAEAKGLTLNIQSENIQLDETFSRQLVGDPVRLKQVLINLVGNALKFTQKGQVDVTVRVIEEKGQQIKLEWKVQDTGIGIPQEHQKTIFDSFRQVSTNSQPGSTGLGLTICQSIVKQMKGEIWVKSKENQGSQFFFTTVFELPEEKQEAIMNSKREKEHNDEKMIHLLVVDDDSNSRLVIERIGTKKGWRVIPAENSREAMAAYEKNRFDVVLMDMELKLEKGSETTAELRRLEKKYGVHTPIIAVTAQALPGDREEILKVGVDDYVAKPYNPEHLIEKIEQWTKSSS